MVDPATWGRVEGAPRDVFAFGVLACRLLLGGHPTGLRFDAEVIDFARAYKAVAQAGRIDWPPGGIEERAWGPVVRACLALRPSDRLTDGAALVEMLRTGTPSKLPELERRGRYDLAISGDAASRADRGRRGAHRRSRGSTLQARTVPGALLRLEPCPRRPRARDAGPGSRSRGRRPPRCCRGCAGVRILRSLPDRGTRGGAAGCGDADGGTRHRARRADAGVQRGPAGIRSFRSTRATRASHARRARGTAPCTSPCASGRCASTG